MYRIKSFVTGLRKTESSSSISSNNSSSGNLLEMKASARIGACTIEGKNHANEDRYFVSEDLSKLENLDKVKFTENVSFVGVYDGHGGSGCSEYLSKVLHRNIAAHEKFNSFSDVPNVLQQTFVETDEEYLSIAKTSLETSGSCAAVALINGLDVTVAHCGDCRAVMKNDKGIVEVTKDHRPSRPSEKSRIMSAGGRIIGGRVAGVLAPSRSFGDLDVKSAIASNIIVSDPDVVTCRADIGKDNHSYLILATDGIWDAMSNEKAMAIVTKAFQVSNDPQKAATVLAETAASLNVDDVTVIVVVWSLSSSSPSIPKISGVDSEKMADDNSITTRKSNQNVKSMKLKSPTSMESVIEGKQ